MYIYKNKPTNPTGQPSAMPTNPTG
jgi:hypothetical protein